MEPWVPSLAVPHTVSAGNLTGSTHSNPRGENRVMDVSHKFLLLLKARDISQESSLWGLCEMTCGLDVTPVKPHS